MIIGACGFTGSGSSAVFDYLCGFDSISFCKSEFVLSHSPDGLEDLDYQLNYHCSKYSSSEIAIQRFLDKMTHEYINLQKDCKNRTALSEATIQYIDKITDASWIGYGFSDRCLHTFCLDRLFFSYILRLVRHMPASIRSIWNIYPAHKMYLSIKPQNFYEITKEFVRRILEIYGLDYSKTILLNQPFSGTNPELGFQFFDDPYAIVVDRDPRDLYAITQKAYVPSVGPCPLPSKDVRAFVDYYKALHMTKSTSERVLYIQFEDLIYKYDETSKRIRDFCKIASTSKFTPVFNPQVSIANTQTFRRFPDLSDEIAFIESSLSEHLFDFESFPGMKASGKIWGWG